MTVNCPLDCQYLQEARLHEKPQAIAPEQIPNRDIRVTEEFLREHEAAADVPGRQAARKPRWQLPARWIPMSGKRSIL